MATSTIKEFLVSLGFKVDDSSYQKFNDGLKKATISAAKLGAAAAVAGGLITKFVETTAQKFDKLGHLSLRVNETAENIQKLGYIASLTGSSVEASTSSLERFSRTIGEAALGVGRGATAFKDFGLSARKSNGELKSTSEMMTEVGNKIRGMESTQQIAVLSKLGIDPTLVGALTSDVSELSNEFDTLYKNAGINSNEAAKGSMEFVDSLTRVKFVFGSLKDAIAINFMPSIKNALDGFRKFMVENSKKIIETITPIINFLLKILSIFMMVAGRIGQAASKIIEWFQKIDAATDGWASKILIAAAAWKYLNLAFLASPIGIILSLGAAILLLVDDFLVWKEGGDSLINWNSNFTRVIAGLVVTIGAVKIAIVAAKVSMAAWAVVAKGAAAAMGIVRVAVLAFNLALYANPIGLVIAAIAALAAGIVFLVKNFDWAREMWSRFIDPILSGLKVLDKAWNKFKGFFGGKTEINMNQSGASALAPSQSTMSSIQNSSSNVNQKTEIHINGGDSPEATGRAVAREQTRINADMLRNMSGAVR